MAVCIEEWQMDSATALAGSGPAYVYQVHFPLLLWRAVVCHHGSSLNKPLLCTPAPLTSPEFTCLQMLEAMADGAVNAGLPRDKAQALAAQTLIGAARMVSPLPLEAHS
jgi:pyrroline-5-carboxylate reductase